MEVEMEVEMKVEMEVEMKRKESRGERPTSRPPPTGGWGGSPRRSPRSLFSFHFVQFFWVIF